MILRVQNQPRLYSKALPQREEGDRQEDRQLALKILASPYYSIESNFFLPKLKDVPRCI